MVPSTSSEATPSPRCAPAHGLRWPARVVICLLACFPAAVLAQTQGYRLDPVHTRVMFTIDHAGYSQAIGTVSGSHGVLVFDPADWRSAKLTVEVPLQRLDMGDAAWTDAVLARRFLDTARYPMAKFVSSHVEPVDVDVDVDVAGDIQDADEAVDGKSHNTARVCGTLTLHGTDRALCMDVTFNQLKRYPLPPFHTTIGFSATATLKRSDFGITAWRSLVGDEVHLRIEAEAQRDGNAHKIFDASLEPADAAAAPEPSQDVPSPPDESPTDDRPLPP